MSRIWTVALAGLLGLSCAVTPAKAQFRRRTLPVYSSGVNPNAPFYNPVMPLYRVAPGLTMQQAMFNTYQAQAAAATLPPWMYGYNPYPPTIVNTGPILPYSAPPVYYPYGSYYNPYLYSSAAAVNPYALYGNLYGNPYLPYP